MREAIERAVMFGEQELGIKQHEYEFRVNNRMKSYGRFVVTTDRFTGHKTYRIELSVNQVKRSGRDIEFVESVLKHELIHMYCYMNGMGYDDGDVDFERMLRKHNVYSTHFGSKGKSESKFIQDNVINGNIQSVKYVAVSDYSEIEQYFEDNIYDGMPLPEGFIKSSIKAYDVLDKESQTVIGTVLKWSNDWVDWDNFKDRTDGRYTGYKTRKACTIPMLYRFHQNQTA